MAATVTAQDRLVLAWLKRASVHAWLLANPNATMPQVKRAFPGMKPEGVRATVAALLRYGDVVEIRGARTVRYRAAKASATADDAPRARLAACGSRNVDDRIVENRMRTRAPDGTWKPKPREPWRTVNRPDDKPPIQNQGGQGARVEARRRHSFF